RTARASGARRGAGRWRVSSRMPDVPRARPAHPDIAELKLMYPLREVVEGAGVRLSRSGSNRFVGLCPFHEDRNPSFYVYADRQRFVCFGCKSRGDVVAFVRLREKLATIADACAWLSGTPAPALRRGRAPLVELARKDRRWDRLTLEEQLVMNTAG